MGAEKGGGIKGAVSNSKCDTVTSGVFSEDFAGSQVAESLAGTIIQ